jgi:hypothetical protein
MAPAPVPVETESGLPQSVSLAANDVAKARAEREAAQAMQKPLPQSDVPVSTPAKPMVEAAASEIKKDLKEEVGRFTHRREEKRQKRENEQKQEELLAKKAAEKPASEKIESTEEAEHNKPTAAGKEQGSMVGKLIVPTAQKPKPEPVQPKLAKPKKLAPGEVFVDEHGNVVIGE